jgi:hypothetical protein
MLALVRTCAQRYDTVRRCLPSAIGLLGRGKVSLLSQRRFVSSSASSPTPLHLQTAAQIHARQVTAIAASIANGSNSALNVILTRILAAGPQLHRGIFTDIPASSCTIVYAELRMVLDHLRTLGHSIDLACVDPDDDTAPATEATQSDFNAHIARSPAFVVIRVHLYAVES